MAETVSFTVPFRAAPQGSKSTGRYGQMYESSKRVKPYREAVAVLAKEAMRGRKPMTGPVTVTVFFYFTQAKSNRDSQPTSKQIGDLDKLVRATFDAMKGIVWEDDSQACILETGKYYWPENEVQISVAEN
jgi:crossover junction endodeoxyribonuclease RusA